MLAQSREREVCADRAVVHVALTNKQVGPARGLNQGLGPLRVARVADGAAVGADAKRKAGPGAIIVADMKRGDLKLADPVALTDRELVEIEPEGEGAFAGEGYRKDALIPGAKARWPGDCQRSRPFGDQVRIEQEERKPAEMIGVEVCEQDKIDR